jgi:quercetin dioxygenase-like cupin family protein
MFVNLNQLQLPEFAYESDPTARVRGAFPFSAATGNKNTAVVYFQVAPGNRLPTHTDSAEEILIILEGSAEVRIGRERSWVSAGEMAMVPALVPHSLLNTGEETLRVVGVFSSNTVMSTFEEPLLPTEAIPAPASSKRTILAPPPIVLEQPSKEAVA